jgi:hypothetical protein
MYTPVQLLYANKKCKREKEKDIPLEGGAVWKMTPPGTKSVSKEKYLSQGCTPVLKGASGRTHPLLKAFQTSMTQ